MRRDLLRDRLTLAELTARDLWAYITTAPPGTAIHHALNEGWELADHLAAEELFELQQIRWAYRAANFEGGKDDPFPRRISRPGVELPPEPVDLNTLTVDQIVPPELVALLEGSVTR